jgi:hypothetical protein
VLRDLRQIFNGVSDTRKLYTGPAIRTFEAYGRAIYKAATKEVCR